MTRRRFTRYWSDASFRVAVDEQFRLADGAAEKGTWITYAIHDPSRADEIGGEAGGLIIYVGQSKEFPKRVRKRMRDAGTAVKRPTDRIDGACYDIMCRGYAPRFSVQERTHSAVDSLVSETNTAKRLISAGYPLLNKWTEQKFAGLKLDRYSVPHDWLWPITAEDALGSAIDLIVRDGARGQELTLDLTSFPPPTRLREIRAGILASGGRTVRLHVR